MLSGIAYTVLLHLIRTSGPVFASQSPHVITLAGVAWGLLLFGERHSLYVWLALALTLGSLVAMLRFKLGMIPTLTATAALGVGISYLLS